DGTPIAAANDHAVTLASAAVARRTIDVESLLSAIHDGGIDAKRKDCRIRAVQFARVQERIFVQLTAGDRARDCGTGRPLIAEEGRLAERDVLRLVVHILAAAGERNTNGTQTTHPPRHRDTETSTVDSIRRMFAGSACYDD